MDETSCIDLWSLGFEPDKCVGCEHSPGPSQGKLFVCSYVIYSDVPGETRLCPRDKENL